MKSDFEISSQQEKGDLSVTVFHIRGDIDTNTFQTLLEKAQEAYQGGARYLLLDLGEVSYVSSAGLRALHSIYKMLRQSSDDEVEKGLRDGTYKSRHLKLLNPSENVRIALKMAGFDMYLESFEDRQQALASFS